MAEDLFQDIPLIELGNLDNDMTHPTVAPTFKPTVPMTVAPTDDMFSDVNISDLTPDFIENNVTGQMNQLYSEKANMGGVGEEIDVGKDRSGNSLKDFGIRAKVQGFADRPNEQDWLLEPHFGKDGTYRDVGGALWIRGKALENAGLEDRDEENRGKDIRLDALPFTGGLKEFALDASADISGDVAEIVLPMATFLMTKGSGAVAAGVRSLVSGIITGLGKFWQEWLEDKAGLNNQEFGEVVQDSIESGVLATAFEGGTSLATPVGRRLLGPSTTRTKAQAGIPFIRKGEEGELKSTVSPERLDMIDRVRKNLEVEPAIKRQTGGEGVNLAGGQQLLIENTLMDTSRQQAINKAVRNSQKKLVDDVRPDMPMATAKGFNVGMDKRINQTVQQEKDTIKNLNNRVDEELKNIDSQLELKGGASGDLGEEFKTILNDSFDDFKVNASNQYAKVDNLTTDPKTGKYKAYVSTKALREVRDEMVSKMSVRESKKGKIVESLPKTLHEDTVKLLDLMEQVAPSKGKVPEQTFQAMQNIRSQLRKIAYSPEAIKDIGQKNAKQLEQAITESFERSKKGLAPQAKAALDKADRFYAENIPKYDEVLFKRLTKNIRVGGSIPPETAPMVQALIQSKSYTKVRNILKLVKEKDPSKIAEIRKADVDGMLKDSLDIDGSYDPNKLQKLISDRSKDKNGNLFNELHGEDANEIRSLVQQLSARDAKIGEINLTNPKSVLANQGIDNLEKITTNIPEGNLKEILKESLEAVKKRDVLYRDNSKLIEHLQAGGDDALNATEYLLSQKNPNAIRQVKKLLGKESDEFKQLQQLGMDRLTKKLVTIKDDPLEIYMEGAKLKKELIASKAKYNELLGKDGYDNLIRFAEEAQFASSNSSFGSIVAASIRSRPWNNKEKIVRFWLTGALLKKLSQKDYFTRGVLSKGKRRASEFAVRAFANTFASQMDNAWSNVVKTLGGDEVKKELEDINLDLDTIEINN